MLPDGPVMADPVTISVSSAAVVLLPGNAHAEVLADDPAALVLVTAPVVGPTPPAALDTFLDSVANCVDAPLLPTPAPRKAKAAVAAAGTRRSARLDKKKATLPPGAGSDAVQEIIARVCGVLDPSVGYDDKAKQAYLDLFATPLAAPVVQAIAGLVSHAKNLTQKKLNSSC